MIFVGLPARRFRGRSVACFRSSVRAGAWQASGEMRADLRRCAGMSGACSSDLLGCRQFKRMKSPPTAQHDRDHCRRLHSPDFHAASARIRIACLDLLRWLRSIKNLPPCPRADFPITDTSQIQAHLLRNVQALARIPRTQAHLVIHEARVQSPAQTVFDRPVSAYMLRTAVALICRRLTS